VDTAADKVSVVGHSKTYAQVLLMPDAPDGSGPIMGCVVEAEIFWVGRWSVKGNVLRVIYRPPSDTASTKRLGTTVTPSSDNTSTEQQQKARSTTGVPTPQASHETGWHQVESKSQSTRMENIATPKDGPSAGSAFTLAFLSVILGKRIKNDIGLTGEIDQDGFITAIGGLEHKLPGAKKAGIKLVFAPRENEKDIEKIKSTHISLFEDGFKVIIVDHIKEILDMALIDSDDVVTNYDTYEQLFNHEKYIKTMIASIQKSQSKFMAVLR
jgi:hypothetical protein